MNVRFVSVVFLLLVSICSPHSVHAAAPESIGLTVLVQQRVKTLEQLVELTRRQYQAGQATIEEYLSAEGELLEAKVELAPDAKSRVAVIGELVGNLKKIEALAKERVASGVASQAEYLRAKAARLKAEIRLARELEK